MDVQTLKNISLKELEEIVDHLREDLEKSVNCVHEQEQELTIQVGMVKQLEEKILTLIDKSELPQLEADFREQQEKANLLEATLIGQYRNLHERELVFKQHLSALLEKQGILTATQNGESVELKLILALLQQQKNPQPPVNVSSSWPRKWVIILLAIALLVFLGNLVYTRKMALDQAKTAATSEVQLPAKIAITALGRIEPFGEVLKIAAASAREGAKIGELFVKEGDKVESGQLIVILDDFAKKQAAVRVAQQEIKVAQANLAIVKAGAKQGEINAQLAMINRLNAQLKTEIQAKQANISRLQAQLTMESLAQKANISRLQSQLKNAQLEFKRYEKLVNEKVISSSELDTRRTTVETAQQSVREAEANLSKIVTTLNEQIIEAQALNRQSVETLTWQIKEAEANLTKIQEVRGVDVIKAEMELQKASASLQQQQADLEQSKIKAPTNGQILKIHAYPGETVNAEQGIAEIGKTDKMIVVAEVYESDISKVKIGQSATITSESGVFDDTLKGAVSEIAWQIGKKDVLSSDPAEDVDVRIVEVKIKLEQQSSKIVSHLTYSKVIVKILID